MFRSFGRRRIRARGYALALVVSGLTAFVAAHVPAFGDPRATFVTFLPAVCAAAWMGGFWPGILATVASAAAADYLFLPPRLTLEIAAAADAFALVLFMATGAFLSILAERLRGTIQRERRVRIEAEREGRQMHRMHELTAALSRAKSPSDVVDACVDEVAYAIGAAAAFVALVVDDGDIGEIAKAVGYRRDVVEAAQQFSLAIRTPVTDALRTQEPVLIRSSAVRRSGYPEIGDSHFLSAHQAVAVFPLIKERRVLGAMAVAFNESRTFSDEELRFLAIAAERTAQGLDRARQQHSAERAREEAESLRAQAHQELVERRKAEAALRESESKYRALAARTSRLHALTAALSEAVTLDAVARAVVHQGKVVTGATGGSVVLLTEDHKEFETLYAEEHADATVEAWHRFRIEPGLCSTAVVETRQPVFIGSLTDWQKRFWRSAPTAADCGYASAAALPLIVENAVIGVLTFHFTAPVNFDEDYVALLISVAQHATQALDRARLYESAQRARATAEAASRLKDDFLSTVSHELRAPLNAILGWASMLRSGSLDPSRSSRAVDSIFTNASRQASLIDDLLDVARIIGGRVALDVHEMNLSETIRGAVEAVMPAAEAKGVALRCDSPAHVSMMGDARRLEQVFVNLIANGVKFTPEGGAVHVRVTTLQGSVEVRVHDTGIGIDPEFFPHLFERFRQADSSSSRRYGGLGLGLSIAKHLVALHRGTIRVDSAGKDQGTTFTVSLPILAAEETQPVVHPPSSETDTGSPMQDAATDLEGVRVLVVDDESDARDIIASALERFGATVVPAESSRDALDALSRTHVDVLLADIAMPDEDGYTFIRKVRALASTCNARVPAAAVTACVRDDERQQALDAGFQIHVPKPIDPAALAESVAALLRTSP